MIVHGEDLPGRSTLEPMEVPIRATPAGWKEVAAALRRMWTPKMLGPASNKAVAVLLGQWWIETNNGVACSNYNLVGIKCPFTKKETILHQYFVTTENLVRGGVKQFVMVKHKQPTNCFRAWRSLDDGAVGWLNTLTDFQFRPALAPLEQGDARGYVQEISVKRGKLAWFNGPADIYADNVMVRAKEFRSKLEQMDLNQPSRERPIYT